MKKLFLLLAVSVLMHGTSSVFAAESKEGAAKPSESSKPIGKTTKPNSPVFESKEFAAAAAATCTMDGQEYKKGATICKNKVEFECGSSGWFKTGKSC